MNETVTTPTSLRISRLIPAPIDRVFEAWTTPEILAKWSAPEGIEHITYDLDLRVGGAYTLLMMSPEGQKHTAVGEYREIDRPNRLVYTWDWVEDEYRMDVEGLARDMPKNTRIIVLCSPQNPGGRAWTVEELRENPALTEAYFGH